ncbi:MAG: universal stress protein [Gemmatimonadota bacterium]
MTAKILVATDGSARSTTAIRTAVGIAKALNATLVACTATPPYPYYGLGEVLPDSEGQYMAVAGATATERLTEAEQVARGERVPFVGVIKEQQHPHAAILQTARENDCELIVMASHGRGEVSSLFLGSETQKVLAFANRPVLVVR